MKKNSRVRIKNESSEFFGMTGTITTEDKQKWKSVKFDTPKFIWGEVHNGHFFNESELELI